MISEDRDTMRDSRTMRDPRVAFSYLVDSNVARLAGQQRIYVQRCWYNELLDARRRSKRNRGWFLLWRFLSVGGALVLPALASLNLGDTSIEVRVATFAVSIIVAISTAAIQVFRFGSHWMLDEWYANALEAEGWAYFQKTAHYRFIDYETGGGFETFFNRIEELRRLRDERRSSDIRAMTAEAATEPSTPSPSEESPPSQPPPLPPPPAPPPSSPA